MRIDTAFRTIWWLAALGAIAFFAWSCAQPSGGGGGNGGGGGTGNDNGGGDGNGGGPTDGGFDDNGLAAPGALPAEVENLPPTGDVAFPPAGATVAAGEVVFLWQASDANGTNLDSTIHISNQAGVFDNPTFTQGIRTPPEEQEHRLAIQLAEAGTFFWGVEITDGVNTIQRPASGTGVEFEVSESGGGRIGIEDAILLCPRGTQPARAVTTFEWSLGTAVPLRTQVFVSRAGQENPFESPLRVFEVDAPTATTQALTEADALPLGEELSWGLRIETADDEVMFSFEGQLGELFTVEENVPPSGELTGPANDSALPDDAVLDLAWWDSPGNCEDPLTLTIALEHLGEATEPVDLFGSDLQLTAEAESAEADLFPQLMELDLEAGRWAWGILADDGTDQTALPDADNPEHTFRTFIRNTSPRFTGDPAFETRTCGTSAAAGDALVFTFEDDNATDAVQVRVSYAPALEDVFAEAAESLELSSAESGVEVVVFLEAMADADCVTFDQGAGFYGVELDDGVNEPVRRTVQYAGPSPEILVGACCAADGSCTEVSSDECTAGIYQGDGTGCQTAECLVLAGACCLPSGACTDGPEADCADGEYQGDGTACDTVECPVLTGACCLPDGTCTEGPSADCTAGEYQGDGSTCELADCPAPPTIVDCNSNGIADADDIAGGSSNDCNGNDVPDDCEGSPTVVDAGVLAAGTIIETGYYSSAQDNNNLSGSVCPAEELPSVLWSWVKGPSDAVNFQLPGLLATSYTISDAVPGEYVFRLTHLDSGASDTVTLTLSSR